MNTIENIILDYLNRVADSIVDDQIAKGLFSSGESAASLKAVVKDGKGALLGAKHFHQQVYGRKPGTMPPIEEIIKWIKFKRINISPWAVAVKMKKEGSAIFRKERPALDIKSQVAKHLKELIERVGIDYATNVLKIIKPKA